MHGAELICADALSAAAVAELHGRKWDVVVGNPPFLSPLSAQVRADSAHRVNDQIAGGQYADTAVQIPGAGRPRREREQQAGRRVRHASVGARVA